MQLEIISRQPSASAHPTALLCVHGLWTGVSAWTENFLDYFAAHGYAAHAFSLRGHGKSAGRERLRWIRLSDYVADVAQVAAQLPAPPVLIGHSMGGAIVQKYLETHSAPAAVLLASIPPTGVLRTTLRIAMQHPWLFLKANLTLSLHPLISTPALARETFFSASMPADKVQTYFSRMQDESFMSFLDILALNLPNPKRIKTPLLVMGAANDTSFHPDQVEATARAYNTQAIIFPNMAHGMMLEEGWQAVADRIIVWLNEKGL